MEDCTCMTVNFKDDFVHPLKTGNVVIAAFVTAYARLELYDLLHTLGKRVLYYDTDSVIYSSCVGEEEHPLGNYVGELICPHLYFLVFSVPIICHLLICIINIFVQSKQIKHFLHKKIPYIISQRRYIDSIE